MGMRRFFSLIAVMSVMTLGLTACAQPAPQEDNDENIAMEYDPLEGFNRAMYRVNYTLDGLIVRPMTMIYRGLVPEIGRRGVSNFLSNLASPVTFVNSVLQGDMDNAKNTLTRFVINTTAGVGGLGDMASDWGYRARNEDFGQTMGKYGVGQGAFVYLPVLGPTSTRDLPGRVVDFFTDPFNYLLSDGWLLARTGTSVIDARARNFELIDDIYANSLDPYATIRSGYTQRRQAEVENRTGSRPQTPTAPVQQPQE